MLFLSKYTNTLKHVTTKSLKKCCSPGWRSMVLSEMSLRTTRTQKERMPLKHQNQNQNQAQFADPKFLAN